MKIKMMATEYIGGREDQSAKRGKIYPLLYLKKALREEAYEKCAYWRGQALKNGATRHEIDQIIREPVTHLEELCCN
jgi:hypothetical protein